MLNGFAKALEATGAVKTAFVPNERSLSMSDRKTDLSIQRRWVTSANGPESPAHRIGRLTSSTQTSPVPWDVRWQNRWLIHREGILRHVGLSLPTRKSGARRIFRRTCNSITPSTINGLCNTTCPSSRRESSSYRQVSGWLSRTRYRSR
jgi:hypothetical protein